jgi:hypothetical protein
MCTYTLVHRQEALVQLSAMELSLKQPTQMALPIQACQPISHLNGSKHVNPFSIWMEFCCTHSGASQDFGCDKQYLQRLWIARAHQFLDICGHCYVMQYTKHLLEFMSTHICVCGVSGASLELPNYASIAI